jgi:2-keto-4-pentenoate hydratase/2-oxohepta-3-ene-1,7-dioic acid hydratase in catechol pathway
VMMQDSATSDMIFDCMTLIADLSRGMTLVPGTLIYTGTPSGVGMARTPTAFLQDGDVVTISLHQSAADGTRVIASCTNRVRFE